MDIVSQTCMPWKSSWERLVARHVVHYPNNGANHFSAVSVSQPLRSA